MIMKEQFTINKITGKDIQKKKIKKLLVIY